MTNTVARIVSARWLLEEVTPAFRIEDGDLLLRVAVPDTTHLTAVEVAITAVLLAVPVCTIKVRVVATFYTTSFQSTKTFLPITSEITTLVLMDPTEIRGLRMLAGRDSRWATGISQHRLATGALEFRHNGILMLRKVSGISLGLNNGPKPRAEDDTKVVICLVL